MRAILPIEQKSMGLRLATLGALSIVALAAYAALDPIAQNIRNLFESQDAALAAADDAGDDDTFNTIADSFITGTVTINLSGSPCSASGSYPYDVFGFLLSDGSTGLVGFISVTNSTVLANGASSEAGAFVYDTLIDAGGSASGAFSTASDFTLSTSLNGSLTATNLLFNGIPSSSPVGDGCFVNVSATNFVRTSFTFTGIPSSGDGVITPNSAGTEVVTEQNLRNNARAIVNAVGSRITAIFSGIGGGKRVGDTFRYDGGSGLAGGDLFAGLPVGVWASYTRSDFEDDFTRTAFEGDRNLAIGGVDISPMENMVFGISAGYEGTDTDTLFNRGNVESDGILVTPYIAYRWAEHYQVDALFGYTSVDTEQFRTSGATRVTSDTSSDRYFWGGNFTGSQVIGNWNLAARFGLLWMREYVDGFTESNGNVVGDNAVELAQWRFGGDAAYTWGNFEPYTNVTYERDFSREPLDAGGRVPGDDVDGFVVGAGIRYYTDSGFTGSFEWNGVLGRDAYSENSYNVFLRYQY
jgi:hypothetical protein